MAAVAPRTRPAAPRKSPGAPRTRNWTECPGIWGGGSCRLKPTSAQPAGIRILFRRTEDRVHYYSHDRFVLYDRQGGARRGTGRDRLRGAASCRRIAFVSTTPIALLLRCIAALFLAACSAVAEDPEEVDAAPPGPKAPLCGNPFPGDPPPLPHVDFDAHGRPLFDLWRDLPCGGLDLCGASSSTCGICIFGTPDASHGVCSGPWADDDTGCDELRPAMTFMDRRCWACFGPDSHARACCAKLAGFDCRAWPFPADGVAGTVCARHEDCESGLVCGPGGPWATGYGICQCPGIAVSLPDDCRFPP